MKVFFSTEGKDLDSIPAASFGHSKMFLIADQDLNTFEVIENNQEDESNGHRQCKSELILNKSVDAVVVRSIGPTAYNRLRRIGVKLYKAENISINENLKKLKVNELKELTEGDISNHHHYHDYDNQGEHYHRHHHKKREL